MEKRGGILGWRLCWEVMVFCVHDRGFSYHCCVLTRGVERSI